MKSASYPLRQYRTLRKDAWWLAPALTAAGLGGFALYALWAVLQDANYRAAPYVSPFYSPSLLAMCVPFGLRLTCYDYRKSYYRSFFFSPPACAVGDAARRYEGESRFPLSLQSLHRYFFYLSVPLLVFLWWDALRAFRFADGFGLAVGTLVLVLNAALLSLFVASCNSCRHACGGHVKSLHDAPLRHRAWRVASALNARHGLLGWISLGSVALADLYVRLLAGGAIRDFRFF